MGWWDEGIMGGDGPLDYKGNFEDEFGSVDADFNKWRLEDGKPAIPFKVPTAEESLKFLEDCRQWKWYSKGDDPVLCQVIGFLVMERGGAMNDELRAAVVKGCNDELAEGCDSWGDPSIRIKVLQDFRALIEAYPAEGSNIELPHQPGLFEKMAGHFT